jgi:hypothetical protein
MRYTSVAGVHLIGARLRAWVLGYIPSKPPTHRPAYNFVGWHAVMCYGAPEWFRLKGQRARAPRPRGGHMGVPGARWVICGSVIE